MKRVLPLCLCLALATVGADDCGEEDPTPTTTGAPPPTFTVPPTTGTTPTPRPTPTPTPTPTPSTQAPAGYDLNQEQAYAVVEAGRAVAGYTAGGDVQIAKSRITVSERRPRQRCQYDTYSGQDECETVYETELVPRYVYNTSGPPGKPGKQFSNIGDAFSYAAGNGASAYWKRVN